VSCDQAGPLEHRGGGRQRLRRGVGDRGQAGLDGAFRGGDRDAEPVAELGVGQAPRGAAGGNVEVARSGGECAVQVDARRGWSVAGG
jgi:hypothetical protein